MSKTGVAKIVRRIRQRARSKLSPPFAISKLKAMDAVPDGFAIAPLWLKQVNSLFRTRRILRWQSLPNVAPGVLGLGLRGRC